MPSTQSLWWQEREMINAYTAGASLLRVKGMTVGLVAMLSGIASNPAYANMVSTIQTPPEQGIEELSNAQSLHELSLANFIASNCRIEGVGAGDAALIAGTAQAVAGHMGLSMDDYFSNFLQPALNKVSMPDACDKHAEATRDIALRLKELGGAVIE
ncbi:hypothetical protein Pden_2741 [Paracoccus denitrificans PD1222]|jgi:hypothetical protein|uniref:Uncharacterized protein n=2 Tax=Paracoccaceae TaxID=31989 RepID=A1B5N1_PARDP|nr:hypothetical protein Pden_2741 [Paracoccus denitrificans PD1222]